MRGIFINVNNLRGGRNDIKKIILFINLAHVQNEMTNTFTLKTFEFSQ